MRKRILTIQYEYVKLIQSNLEKVQTSMRVNLIVRMTTSTAGHYLSEIENRHQEALTLRNLDARRSELHVASTISLLFNTWRLVSNCPLRSKY